MLCFAQAVIIVSDKDLCKKVAVGKQKAGRPTPTWVECRNRERLAWGWTDKFQLGRFASLPDMPELLGDKSFHFLFLSKTKKRVYAVTWLKWKYTQELTRGRLKDPVQCGIRNELVTRNLRRHRMNINVQYPACLAASLFENLRFVLHELGQQNLEDYKTYPSRREVIYRKWILLFLPLGTI